MPIVSRWKKPGIYQPAQMLLSSLIPMENYRCPHQNQLSLILKDSPLEMIISLFVSLSFLFYWMCSIIQQKYWEPLPISEIFLSAEDSLHCKSKKQSTL